MKFLHYFFVAVCLFESTFADPISSDKDFDLKVSMKNKNINKNIIRYRPAPCKTNLINDNEATTIQTTTSTVKGCENGGTPCSIDEQLVCFCPEGFYGDRCESEDVDECLENPCVFGECINLIGPSPSYECDCDRSWLTNNCEGFSSCENVICQNGGTCFNDNQGYSYCACPGPFGGEYCELNVCNPDPCQNGGTCSTRDQNREYRCDCPQPYHGPDCTMVGTPECTEATCQNGGICKDLYPGTFCDCSNTLHSGYTCEDDFQSGPDNCQNGGERTFGLLYPSCLCQGGYTGPSCDILDECEFLARKKLLDRLHEITGYVL